MSDNRSKTVKKGNTQLDVTFADGQIHYDVNNGDSRGQSTDLYEALGSANVKPKRVGFFSKAVKKLLGF